MRRVVELSLALQFASNVASAQELQPASISVETDLATVLAIGATTYFTTAIIHEGLGHELGCALGGGRPSGFSVAAAACDETGLTLGGRRILHAGGSAANFLAGSGFATSLLLAPPETGPEYYFLWLSTVLNLHQAAGYMMVGAWLPAGDWGTNGVLEGVASPMPWQIGISLVGLGLTAGTVFLGNYLAEPLLGGDSEIRSDRQWTTALWPYLLGASLITGSSILNRVGPEVIASAAIANFMGTLFLAYIPIFFSSDPFYLNRASSPERPLSIERSTAWLVVGTAAALASVFVFGPGVGEFDEPHPFDVF